MPLRADPQSAPRAARSPDAVMMVCHAIPARDELAPSRVAPLVRSNVAPLSAEVNDFIASRRVCVACAGWTADTFLF